MMNNSIKIFSLILVMFMKKLNKLMHAMMKKIIDKLHNVRDLLLKPDFWLGT
ncbi:hypothetical protein SPTER_28230 [Sporomusa termitida]|uniref:Uncharacterized protein n=1 Tax=Sporomusa termitida TaxID=2377 RepID=A0A517DVQ4_9FIRM|nr:hypothetical protein SPTER_28230 [Sporomusa termitida]